MTAPKWWYYFLAICIAVLTVAASYRLLVTREKWQHLVENGIFNPATGETCWVDPSGGYGGSKMVCTERPEAASSSDSAELTPFDKRIIREADSLARARR